MDQFQPSASGYTSSSPSPAPSSSASIGGNNVHDNNNVVNAPKYGTLVPNRVFVGGLDPTTTDYDLQTLFSGYGEIKLAKVIVDRAGVSKGYGFITFANEEDVNNLIKNTDKIKVKDRKLAVAPAIKKQPFTGRFYENVPQSHKTSLYTGPPLFYSNTQLPFSVPGSGNGMLNNPYTTGHFDPMTMQHYDPMPTQYVQFPQQIYVQQQLDYNIANMQAAPGMTGSPNLQTYAAASNLQALTGSPNLQTIQTSTNLQTLQGATNLQAIHASGNLQTLSGSPNMQAIQGSTNVQGLPCFPMMYQQHGAPQMQPMYVGAHQPQAYAYPQPQETTKITYSNPPVRYIYGNRPKVAATKAKKSESTQDWPN